VARRVAGEPLQYLTGLAGFRRLELRIGPGALVPRPETESLAGRAIELIPKGGTVVDIGTGAGPIALSIADERPDVRVIATEISDDALEWARRNRDALGLEVEMILCDLFEGLTQELRRSIDVIISNPPYISENERSSLPTEVADHEPDVALFAARDGLEIFERIAFGAKGWLVPGGVLLSEIGDRQGDTVTRLLRHLGYESPVIREDLVGRPRIAEAVWRP
jgi:release factor glutamine methyltransferase